MGTVTFIYEAKCKHCIYATSFQPLKKDGTKSKRWLTKCGNPESKRGGQQIRLKDKACEQFQ